MSAWVLVLVGLLMLDAILLIFALLGIDILHWGRRRPWTDEEWRTEWRTL